MNNQGLTVFTSIMFNLKSNSDKISVVITPLHVQKKLSMLRILD